MKTLLKIIKKLLKLVIYSIIAFFVLGLIISSYYTSLEKERKNEETAGMEFIKSYPVYHGVCNEIYKGKIEIYYSPKDSLYYQRGINEKLTPTYNKKEHMEYMTSHWTKENLAKERSQSEKCVAKRKARADRYNEEKRRREEAHDLLEDLLDELN